MRVDGELERWNGEACERSGLFAGLLRLREASIKAGEAWFLYTLAFLRPKVHSWGDCSS